MNVEMNKNIIVKKYELFKPQIDEVGYLPDKVIKDCRNNFSILLNLDMCMIVKLQIKRKMKKYF